MHSNAANSSYETSDTAVMLAPTVQLPRPPVLRRQVLLGEQALQEGDRSRSILRDAQSRLNGTDSNSFTNDEYGRSLPVGDYGPTQSSVHPSSQPRTPRVIRLSEFPIPRTSLPHDDQSASAKEEMPYEQVVSSNTQGAMPSQFRNMSLGEMRSDHDTIANDGHYQYQPSGHGKEQAKTRQVVYLGETSKRSAGPHEGRSQSDRQPQQPRSLTSHQFDHNFTLGDQQAEFRDKHSFGEVAPQRKVEARCILSARCLCSVHAYTSRYQEPRFQASQKPALMRQEMSMVPRRTRSAYNGG